MDSFFNLNKRKNIFIYLLIGKLLLLPFIYLLFNYFDSRTNSLFLLGDFSRYEDSQNILKIFDFGTFTSKNIGYMGLIFILKNIISSEYIRLIIYSIVSLVTMSSAQAIVLDIVFTEKKISSIKIKIASIILSILNFYILIYSFKPSSDVFGCLGIAILIQALILSKEDNNENKFLVLCLTYLFLCLFRNNLILAIPFLIISKIPYQIKKEISFLKFKRKFFVIALITGLFIINIFQFASAFTGYRLEQSSWGFVTIKTELINYISFDFLKEFIIFIFSKLIYLLSVRESVGMTGNWLYTIDNGTIISSNPIFTNIITAIFLFTINLVGIFTIFKFFSNKFKYSFLFSLIPLIPLISFASHHRYFLPYSIITTACFPFFIEIIKKNKFLFRDIY